MNVSQDEAGIYDIRNSESGIVNPILSQTLSPAAT
jgi:hypothetical protein